MVDIDKLEELENSLEEPFEREALSRLIYELKGFKKEWSDECLYKKYEEYTDKLEKSIIKSCKDGVDNINEIRINYILGYLWYKLFIEKEIGENIYE